MKSSEAVMAGVDLIHSTTLKKPYRVPVRAGTTAASLWFAFYRVHFMPLVPTFMRDLRTGDLDRQSRASPFSSKDSNSNRRRCGEIGSFFERKTSPTNRCFWELPTDPSLQCSRLRLQFAIARAGRVRPYLDWNFPRFDPMFRGEYANHRSSPSTMAVRIEPVSTRNLKILLRACTCRSKRNPALRASE